jgi:hypothetical protein
MSQESINLNLAMAICLYGTSNANLPAIQQYCYDQLSRYYDIEFFDHIDDKDTYASLWRSCFKKRHHELEIKKDFDICLAIDLADDTMALMSEHSNLLSIIPCYKDDKLYYVRGSFTGEYAVTEASPQMFFSNSLTFDFACNFGIEQKNIPLIRKKKIDDKNFYYFLKTLKIKTQCVHFENPKLFEISL